jgi:hypothetical protein
MGVALGGEPRRSLANTLDLDACGSRSIECEPISPYLNKATTKSGALGNDERYPRPDSELTQTAAVFRTHAHPDDARTLPNRASLQREI